jgi:hypothetical protein
LLILLWLSVCGLASTEAPSQPVIKYFYRSSIEACPEEKKRPVLRLLDEARARADRTVRLFAEGQIMELYALMSMSFRKEYSEARFLELLAAMEQREGKILKHEYHDQFLMDVSGSPWEFDPQGDRIIVRYAIKTTGREDGAYLKARMRLEGTEPVVERIDISHDVSPDTSAKRPETQAPSGAVCPIIRDSLK